MPHSQRQDRSAVGSAIRLLIVDDSLVVRTILHRMLEGRPEFAVVASAANTEQAEAALSRHAVDIILLDVEMPGTDGLTALPRLLALGRGARVLIVSSVCQSGARSSLRAMAAGAADTLLKPSAGAFGSRFETELVDRLLRIGPARPSRSAPTPAVLRSSRDGPVQCVAIGSSTGGLHALADFFAGLPVASSAPIVVTQHLPPVFIPFFATQVTEMSGRRCEVAHDGAVLRSGQVLVAAGDGHLVVERRGGALVARVSHEAAGSGCTPSVDPMFASLAEAAGAGTIGVVLSGMGRDGAAGAAELVGAGATVLAQDEASSVVWGMPGAVVRGGLASLVARPATLAAFIADRAPC